VDGRPSSRTTRIGCVRSDLAKKIQGRVTFFDALPLKTPEAQASDNSLLVFIQQWEGRSTEWPSFFVQIVGREKKIDATCNPFGCPPVKDS
jgi:hypothetical protein